MTDFRVENHVTLFVVQPLTEEAHAHLAENTAEEALWWAGGLIVEPRYLEGLLEGLEAAGFSVADV